MPAIIDRAPEALHASAFRASLVAAAESLRAEDTRLHRLLMTGRCPASVVQRYARATVRSADLFCATLAEMAEKAPDRDSRLTLLENLMEEEGVFLQPTRGLTVRPEASHPALARRFATAVGVTDGWDAATHATGPGRDMLARGDWVEAVAHLLVGQELLFATTAPAMGRALQHAGVAARDLAFFWVHETADREHGEQAIKMVVRHAHGRVQQERCIAETHAGVRAWAAAHGGVAE